MAISQNFPEEGPTLNLNFAGSKVLDPRITFSRSSVGTYMDANGLVATASTDSPRFDHRYVNGEVESLGLLVEEQRTNVLEQSVATTSNWTGSTSNTTYSNLSLNALGIFPGVEVTSTTGAAWHRRTTGSNVPFVSGTKYAVTFYYREGTSGYVRLQFRYNSQESLVQGPADGSSWYIQQNIGSITNVTTTLMDGQSTYKTSYIFTPNFTGDADMGIGIGIASAGTTVIALGGQVEAGEFPTSYIPTSAGISTRGADNVTMTGTNFSDWYNQSEGTLYASASILGKNIHTTGVEYPNGICKLSDTGSSLSFSRVLYFGGNSDPDRVSFGNRDSSSSITVVDNTFGDIQSNQYYKVCGAYITNDEQAMCLNGGDIKFNGTNVNPPTPNQLLIGTGYNGAIGNAPGGDEMYLNGHISQLTYYPTRLSNTVLQNLTK